MDRIRIDKWLWAARFFKTRSLASRACDFGRIECNGQPVKPSREIRAGDSLRVKTEAGDFRLQVLALSEIRGPAPVARSLYEESEASIEARRKAAEERRAMPRLEAIHEGKPSKRDRRRLDRVRGRP